MRKTFTRLELGVVLVVALLLIVLAPWLNAAWGGQNAAAAAGSTIAPAWWTISDYTLNIWGKYLCYALLAISVDLLWGYTGLLSLGQSLFFSLGGYMLGMNLMLMIGKLGSFAKSGQNPNLVPDFLFFLGHTELPGFWRPFYSFPFAAAMVLVIPGMLALFYGWLTFRARIKGVYFSILTQAFTYVGSLLFFRNAMLMGGNNGFTDFKFILGADVTSAPVKRTLYICSAVALVGVYLFCRWLTGTRFGLVQRAVRDSETRVLFSGYPVARYKLFVFVISAVIASIGGALFTPQVGIINPGEMKTDKSLEAVVWCAVGGRGTLIGPIVGAVGVNALKSWAVRNYPDYWYYMLGGLFILMVILVPGGVVGLPAQLKALLGQRTKPDDQTPPAVSPQKPDITPVADPGTAEEARA